MARSQTDPELKYLHALHVVYSNKIYQVHSLIRQYLSAETAWNKIAHKFPLISVELEWEKLNILHQNENLELITLADNGYPNRLKQIAQPPHILYCRGNLKLLKANLAVSIVGTRKATNYGKQVVKDAVNELVRADAVIVSGLAFGIDATTHQAALAANGQTIAVLGSSVLDQEIAPHTNLPLAIKILEQDGLLISEYPPGTQIYPSFFPERNRIIAGLSQATIVVEAAQRSGSLITARFALESNREVFAVPGSIYAAQSAGTNDLIAKGATSWLSCLTLFDELEYLKAIKKPKFAKTNGQILSSEETTILEQFTPAGTNTGEPLTIDKLIEKSRLSAASVTSAITTLSFKGLIIDIGGKYTVKK